MGLLLALAGFAGAVQAGNSCQVPSNTSALFSQIDQGLNQIRDRYRLDTLEYNPSLARAAQDHACDMATLDFFSHNSSDGSNVQHRARRSGYHDCLIAENIAHGTPYSAPNAVLQGWMDSSGHRKNMMLRRVSEYGIGVAVDHDGPYWVLVLAKGC